MNYQRTRKQAAFQKFLREKLAEKREVLRSLTGSEKDKAEKMIIAKAKKEFELGYKNSKQKASEADKKPKKPTLEELVKKFFDEGKTKDEIYKELYNHDFQSAPYDCVEDLFEDEDPENNDGDPPADPDADPENNDGSDDDKDPSDEDKDPESPELKSEEELEALSEEEVKAYAESHGVDIGNSSSKNGYLKKIRKHFES
jgi:hypothetical protein